MTLTPLDIQTHYDSKCEDLAESFLDDCLLHEEVRKFYARELAQKIQQTIEDFLNDKVPEDMRK